MAHVLQAQLLLLPMVLDEYSPGSSLQKYNSTSGAWDKVTNTYTETQTGNATNAANKAFLYVCTWLIGQ